MTKNKYPCTQHELYFTAADAWNLFVLHIGDFTSFRKAYSVQHYEERMNEIEEAKQTPELTQLQYEMKELRKKLVNDKKDVLHYYNCTKEYVKCAFNKEMADGYMKLLHKRKYAAAANNNWMECMALIVACKSVLNRSKDELLQNENMYAAFIDEAVRAFDKFGETYIKYAGFKRTVGVKSMIKVALNNRIYKDVTTMLHHAQLVYRHRPDMQQLFRFNRLIKTTRSKKTKPVNKVNKVSFLSKVTGMF